MLHYNFYIACILFTTPLIKINNYNKTVIKLDERPNDPSLSCYLINNTWCCIPDVKLYGEIDPEDSY